MNRAVTAVSTLTVTAHDGAVEQDGAPPQPANRKPGSAVAVSVTTPPSATSTRQPEAAATPSVTVQASPSPTPGPLATLPLPVPEPATRRLAVCRLKVAVTDRGASRLTKPAAVPLQSPAHPRNAHPPPANAEPPAAVALRVTPVPPAYSAAQLPVAAPAVMVQAMPSGLAATEPSPSPAPATVSVARSRAKAAPTVIA